MSRTCFRVNPHYILAWMSRNYLLEAGAKSEVYVTATGLNITANSKYNLDKSFEEIFTELRIGLMKDLVG